MPERALKQGLAWVEHSSPRPDQASQDQRERRYTNSSISSSLDIESNLLDVSSRSNNNIFIVFLNIDHVLAGYRRSQIAKQDRWRIFLLFWSQH